MKNQNDMKIRENAKVFDCIHSNAISQKKYGKSKRFKKYIENEKTLFCLTFFHCNFMRKCRPINDFNPITNQSKIN